MPQTIIPLTDDELVTVPQELLGKLTPAERRRLDSLRASDTPAPREPKDLLDRLIGLLPMAGGIGGGLVGGIGGTVAGMGVGGIPGATGGAALGGMTGESLRQLLTMLRDDASLTTPESARRIATQGAIQGGAELAGGLVAKGATKGAQAVYRGYLKPSLAARNIGKADDVVRTALDEALPITRGGVAKAQATIGQLNQQVDDLLKQSPDVADLKSIGNQLRQWAQRTFNRAGADPSDLQAALAVADRIDAHASLMLPGGGAATTRSLADVNEVKRTLQEAARGSYGAPNAAAKKAAEKKGAYLTRQVVEGKTGGVTGAVATLNARESKLIDAARAIKQAVEREANQNVLHGAKSLASGALGGAAYAGGAVSAPVAAAGALATRGALHPAVASRAAILANRLSRELGVSASTASRLAAYVLTESGDDEE